MKFSAGFVGLDFIGATRQQIDRIGSGVLGGVSAAAEGFKLDWRQQVHRAGLGIQLGNAVGSKVYPNRKADAAAIVYPRGQVAERIFTAFNSGDVIRAGNGKRYLALPTRDAFVAGRGGKRLTPEQFERFTGVELRAIESKKPGVLLLVGRRYRGRVRGASRDSVVYFVLVSEVRLGRRLSIDALAATWLQRLPDLIETATPREA